MICKKCKQDVSLLFEEQCIECYDDVPRDYIVEKVINSFKDRAKLGYFKYGTTLMRNDLGLLDWLNHLQDEMKDAVLYIEKLKTDMMDKDDIHFKLSEQGYFDTTKEDDES